MGENDKMILKNVTKKSLTVKSNGNHVTFQPGEEKDVDSSFLKYVGLEEVIVKSSVSKKSFKKNIFDVNGDGVVDAKDLVEVAKKAISDIESKSKKKKGVKQ